MSSAISGPPMAATTPSAPQEAVTAAETTSVSDITTNLRKRRIFQDSTGSPEPTTAEIGQPFAPSNQQHHPITNAILTPPPGEFFINLVLQVAGIVAAIAFGVFAVESVNVAKIANTLAKQAIEEGRVANQVAMLALCTQATDNTPSFCGRILGNENSVLQSEVTALFTAKVTSAVPTTTEAFSLSSFASFSTGLPPASSTGAFTTAVTASISTTQSKGAPPTTTVPSAAPTTRPGSAPGPSSGPSRVVIIGTAVPVGAILLVILVVVTVFCMRSRRRQMNSICTSGDASADAYDTTLPGKEEALLGSRPMDKGWRRWWNIYRALFMESRVSTSS